MKHFLIFARPRSRTAWCANWLTTDKTICFHEGLADSHGSTHHLRCRMSMPVRSVSGNADTAHIHNPLGIIAEFPQAKQVFLTGASLSWEVFAQKRGFSSGIRDLVRDSYDLTRKLLKDTALFVDVHELLRDATVAENMWNHCMQGELPFDRDRWDMLRNLNVQVVPETLERRIR